MQLLVPEPITVALPEASLRSICQNLLGNALKFRRPNVPLRLRLIYQPQQDYQGFAIEDNGLDLDAAQAHRFALFQRQHPQVPGAGVGLYVANKPLENAGGSLTVRSQPGEGATFTVRFPR